MTGASSHGIDRPYTVLIAALGGEGGGLLTDWIVEAATASGLLVQATSIPGVAQRTGATTYYIEIMKPLDGATAEPVFALYPAPGYVDMAVASELIEAGRLIENGYVTPDRTALIASTHRVYAMSERTAMGDGAFPATRVIEAARTFAKTPVLADFEHAAHTADGAINAVLLGAMTATVGFPLTRDAIAEAIRTRGVAVDANLRVFQAGFEHLGEAAPPSKPEIAAPTGGGLRTEIAVLPVSVHDVVIAGGERLRDYQDDAYADLYLDRLRDVARIEGADDPKAPTLRECARYLALWMAYEDVIRVADIKSSAARHRRIRDAAGAGDTEPVRVTEFFKPGLEEFATFLPAPLGRLIVNWAIGRGIADRLHIPLHIRSDTIIGHRLLRIVAARKKKRRKTLRFRNEQAGIERWLDGVRRGLEKSPQLGHEIALMGRIIKGYGETRARAMRNFDTVFTAIVEPGVIGRQDPDALEARIARAREACLADDSGKALAALVASEHNAATPDAPAAAAE